MSEVNRQSLLKLARKWNYSAHGQMHSDLKVNGNNIIQMAARVWHLKLVPHVEIFIVWFLKCSFSVQAVRFLSVKGGLLQFDL